MKTPTGRTFTRKVEHSSFGTPSAKKLRRQTSDAVAARIVRQAAASSKTTRRRGD